MHFLPAAFLEGGATPNQGGVWVRDAVHGELRVYVPYDQSDQLLNKEATVACMMLGLAGQPRAIPFSSVRHRENVLVVKYCHGNESSLFHCSALVNK